MSEPNQAAREKLVEIHRARDGWEGSLLTGYLRDNGIEAAFQGDQNVSFDMKELLRTSDEAFGVYVLEHERDQAKALIDEFLGAALDPAVMEEAAAHRLKVDKEAITRLRGALREERQTFGFLGWLGMVFLGATAVLWLIWPAWLKMEVPSSMLRWAMVILLALGAVFAGKWSGQER